MHTITTAGTELPESVLNSATPVPSSAALGKDWEVVSYKKNDMVYSLTENGLYDNDDLPFKDVQSGDSLAWGGFAIHSVKRVSSK